MDEGWWATGDGRCGSSGQRGRASGKSRAWRRGEKVAEGGAHSLYDETRQ